MDRIYSRVGRKRGDIIVVSALVASAAIGGFAGSQVQKGTNNATVRKATLAFCESGNVTQAVTNWKSARRAGTDARLRDLYTAQVKLLKGQPAPYGTTIRNNQIHFINRLNYQIGVTKAHLPGAVCKALVDGKYIPMEVGELDPRKLNARRSR